MKELKWLITDEDFNSITHDYEWDAYVFRLWDNGITSPKDAEMKLHPARFEYTEPDCSFCGLIDRHCDLGNGQYKCNNCSKTFSIISGTYLNATKLEYHYWFRFAYLVGEMKIKDTDIIANDLGISKKTAWGMIELLRETRKTHANKPFVNSQDALVFYNYHDVIELLLKRKKPVKINWPNEPEPPELVSEPVGKVGKVFSIDALKSIYKTSFSRDINNTPTLKEFINEDLTVGDLTVGGVTRIKELENKIEIMLDEKATKVIESEVEVVVVVEEISDTIKEIEMNSKKTYEFGK